MLQSHPIVIDGVFVGAAVRLDTGYRFVATDSRLEDLDGTTWPALEDVRARASRLWRTGSLSAPRPVSGGTPDQNLGTEWPGRELAIR